MLRQANMVGFWVRDSSEKGPPKPSPESPIAVLTAHLLVAEASRGCFWRWNCKALEGKNARPKWDPSTSGFLSRSPSSAI